MRCPRCQERDDKVVETRGSRNGNAIRRRRECGSCAHRFTTYETIERSIVMVVKKDDRREAYDRAKLMRGMSVACAKLPISSADLEALVERIETEVHNSLNGEVASDQIGKMVMRGLIELDKVAYVRFASVYRRYQDMGDFLEEVRDLVDE